MTAPICPTCQTPARLTGGAEIYPHRSDLAALRIWKCDVCPNPYVGCHPGTEVALGTPAGPDLRKARMTLHHSRIDPLWKRADQCGAYQPEDARARKQIQRAARVRVYAYLADRMGLTTDETHTGMFSIEQCREAWRVLTGVSYPQIRAWVHQRETQKTANLNKGRTA